MYPFLDLGIVVVPTKPLLFIAGAWIAIWLLERLAKHNQLDGEVTANLGYTVLVTSAVFSRLIFAGLFWSSMAESLRALVWPLTVGYSGFGAVAGAFLGFIYFCRRHRLNYWQAADAVVPGVLVIATAFVAGDWLAGPGYGRASAMLGGGRHLVQLYELLVMVFVFVIWWSTLPKQVFRGYAVLVSGVVFGFGLMLLVPFRATAVVSDGGMYLNQFLFMSIMLGCVAMLVRFAGRFAADELAQNQ